MTEHLLDVVLSRGGSVLGLAMLLAGALWRGTRRWFGAVGVLLVATGTLGHLVAGAESIMDGLSVRSFVDVMRHTAFGAASARVLAAALLFVVLRASVGAHPRVGRAAVLLAALLFAFSLAAQGHGAESSVRSIVQAVHLWAGAVWLAGLFALVDQLERGEPRGETVLAFSRVAVWLMLVVAATGLARTTEHVGAIRDLVASDYGRVLVLKMIFAAGALAFALRHRLATLPSFRREGAPPRSFGRELTVELLLALCTLLAAVTLGQLPPPRG